MRTTLLISALLSALWIPTSQAINASCDGDVCSGQVNLPVKTTENLLDGVDEFLDDAGNFIDDLLEPILGEDGIFRGGSLSGLIQGEADAPRWLEDVEILTDSILEHVIIGTGVTLPENFTLKEGVRFVNSELIPEAIALTDSIPKVDLAAFDDEFIQPLILDLKHDPIVDGEGLLKRMNALASFDSTDLSLEQTEAGILILDVGDQRFSVNPVEIVHQAREETEAALGLRNGYFLDFNLEDELQIQTQPAIQDLVALRDALQGFGLDNFDIDEHGIIHIRVDDNNRFSVRPDWVSVLALSTGHPVLAVALNYATLSFSDEEGLERLQRLFPAPADLALLDTAVDGLTMNADGEISFNFNETHYQGVLDYLVESDLANPSTVFGIEVLDIAGFELLLRYPNGDQQRFTRSDADASEE